jgi:hypothetical protein
MKKWALFVLSCMPVLLAQAQQTDSVVLSPADTLILEAAPYRHSVQKAVRYSAMLPGLGQAYNRKYWKIPIIYGLGGFTVYTAVGNHREYIRHRDAYRIRVDGNPETVDEFVGIQSNAQLRANRDVYRNDRDLFWILTAAVYALNLVDASVDAHLFHFNVSDDLSVRLMPEAPYYHLASGQWHTPVATIRLKL